MPDMTLIEAIVREAYGVELEHTAGESRKAYIASAVAILDVVREAITPDPDPELVFEPCACKEVTLARGQLRKVTDSRYRRTTHYRECCNVVSPIPKPEPVPQWREWVTAQHDEVVSSRASALEDVLMCLSEVERGASKNYALARIVARCEREVGDGWQADPSGWVATPALHALLRCVAGVPTGPGTAWPETDWQGLANAASAWLRDITQEGAQ